MIIKISRSQGREIVAVCDEELLGKVIEEGRKMLDLTAPFYQGDKKSEEETIAILKRADNLNLVGEKAIALAKKIGLIDEGHVRTIGGVPFANVIVTTD